MTELKHNGKHVFRVGQTLTLKTKPTTKKEEQEVTNAEKTIMNELAKAAVARRESVGRVQIGEQVGSPPPVILARTTAKERIEEHYSQPGTVRTNANGVKGMESYAPPPCILADPEED